MTTGKIVTPPGREFSFPDMERYPSGKVSHFTQIKNYPVQSFATADIVPVVLLEIDDRLSDCNSCIVNTVHDSIVVDVHPDEEVKVLSIIRNVNDYINGLIQIQFGVSVNVPLLLESKIGDNWLDTKDV